MKLLGNLGT